MAARQINAEDRRARRQRVDEPIGKLRAGIAQRALFGEGSLDECEIDELAAELDGLLLAAPEPNGLGSPRDGEEWEASLFREDQDMASGGARRRTLDESLPRPERTRTTRDAAGQVCGTRWRSLVDRCARDPQGWHRCKAVVNDDGIHDWPHVCQCGARDV